jgi:hypothetical protein
VGVMRSKYCNDYSNKNVLRRFKVKLRLNNVSKFDSAPDATLL